MPSVVSVIRSLNLRSLMKASLWTETECRDDEVGERDRKRGGSAVKEPVRKGRTSMLHKRVVRSKRRA